MTEVPGDPTLDHVVRKVMWRIVPLMFLGSMLANVDKSNVGMASLQMNSAVGLSPGIYGFGVGLFFIVYALCEVPSNVGLGRFGARVWLTRIMLTWGVVSVAGALIVGPRSFILNRVLLGMAEAGSSQVPSRSWRDGCPRRIAPAPCRIS